VRSLAVGGNKRLSRTGRKTAGPREVAMNKPER